MTKRIWIAAAFALSALTVWAQKASDFQTDGSGVITGYTGSAKAVVIPSKIGNEDILVIGKKVFYYEKITSVTIPNSVTSIGEGAFYINQLTSVTIPNSVTSIGYGAFQGNQLTSVTIPDSVTSIGSGAFKDNQLTSVVIGKNVRTIRQDAFSNNKITSVTIIPEGVAIYDGAFGSDFPFSGAGTYTKRAGVWSKE